MPVTSHPDIRAIRSAFPALRGDTVFLENAGGSQVPGIVADAVRQYMIDSYVQVEAPYALSERATETVHRAHELVSLIMNGGDVGSVILGPSTTALCNMLAGCYLERLQPGDEVIVAESGHEANVGPWVRLGEAGITVRTWRFDSACWTCPLDGLKALLGDRTRIVALPHVSNLLGRIDDVKSITEAAHEAGARVVVDGVAYAPHRAIDVRQWGVDWYAFSLYKVYGPHMAALFGTHEAIGELRAPNHFFVPDRDVPYSFEPGGVCHEGCAGILALGSYLSTLAGRPPEDPVDRQAVLDAGAVMAACEQPLIERVVGFLDDVPDVRVIGPGPASPQRVGTISFLHRSRSSREIAEHVCASGIGIRHGHMYAYRLCEALGLDPEDGVVRVSLVHYNSEDEIERLIRVLEEVL